MMSLQRSTHSSHPAPGTVPTAAQRALQQERNSLPSLNAAAAAAATAAAASASEADDDGDEDDETSFEAPTQPLSPVAQQQQQQQPTSAKARSARNSAADGMRREWKFALQFVHVAGQLLVQCSPQWEYEFIDIDRTAYGLAQRTLPSSTDATPMLAVLSYTDRTAVVQAVSPTANAHSPVSSAARRVSGNGSAGSASAAAYEDLGSHPSAAGGSAERLGDAVAAAAAASANWWLEKSKHVELFYCHSAPDMTMESFCKRCVKFVLRDPHVVSVDGDSRLAHLRVGDKLRCPHRLGGLHRSFSMRYVVRDRSELQETYVYAIGALVGQRGYFLRAECTSAEELEGYVRTVLLPNYAAVGRAQFGVDVTYHNVPPTTLLTDQQEAFGELQYVDHKAAIVFVTPVYPMKMLPDYSPAKTVGVGSITCMTMELSVHERLLDDAVAAEILGVAKYKVNPVVLCVEVEEVSRMGYPKVMSTEQYSELKAKRVADVFPDAKMVGLPTSLYMGNRTGRSRTMTFTYDPLRCVVKALVTSTLVGNLGVTAFYLTKLSGGLFDSHLYVFQQLLSGMEYLPQNNFAKNTRVSRYRVQNIRLGEEDLIRAYRCTGNINQNGNTTAVAAARNGEMLSTTIGGDSAAGGAAAAPLALPPHPAAFTTGDPTITAAARERHLHMLTLGNDGIVEGGVVAVVPVEEGGVPSRRTATNAATGQATTRAGRTGGRRPTAAGEVGVAPGATRPNSASLFSASRSVLTVMSMLSGGNVAAASGVEEDPNGVFYLSGDGGGRTVNDEDGAEEGRIADGTAASAILAMSEAVSTHSGSRISVEGISHLLSSASDSHGGSSSSEEDEEDEDEEEGGMDFFEQPLEHSLGSQETAMSPSLGDNVGPSASAATAAAVEAGASASASSYRHNSLHSALLGSASVGHGDGVGGGSTASRPSSAKRRKHSAHRSPLGTLLTPSALASPTPGAEVRDGSAVDPSAAEPSTSATTATMAASGRAEHNAAASAAKEEALRQQELYEQLVGKGDALVEQTLREGEGGTLYGPSLRDVYARCCESQQCRPNSYLMQKLPAQPELTYSVEELDLSSNYVGHNGFVAVLHLLEHLPRLRVVYFNNMSLDNTDVESLCYVLATNATVREVHLENNTGISLPSTRHFTALLRVNQRIETLALDGTRLSPSLVKSLRTEASRPRN